MAWANLPANYSNKRKVERLESGAAASLHRMSLRLVPGAGANFSIWSALRTHAEQVALFKANYTPTSRGRKYSTDRAYAGRIWARKAGGVSVASPDLGSNHQDGKAIDIHGAAVQRWLAKNGLRFGWSHDEGARVGEAWHYRYIASKDQYRGEGTPRIADIQRKLGIEADGKVGTGFVAAIRAYQKLNGLTVDGIAGPATQAKILGGSGKGDAAPSAAPAKPAPSLIIAALPTIETDRTSANVNKERFGETVQHITVHWWGTPSGQKFEGIRDYLVQDRGDSGTSAHYVVEAGRVARIVPEEWTAWANGNRLANRQGISIECNPNDVEGTIPTLAALIRDIRSRHGDIPVFPHRHWTATECPGDYTARLDAIDTLARTGKAPAQPAQPVTPKPATGTKLPEGKALLMKLKDLQDFPLLRTEAHKCYYGDEAKKESVSGKSANSLNPGEIFGSGATSGARGLKAWQKKVGIAADGRFGPKTNAAAKALQKKAGLTVDGKIGPATFYAAWLVN